MYINEIIRVTYKCNWKCKFCNVGETNNYGKFDISDKKIIYQILLLSKKYSLEQRRNLILSFSGGEPTLNKNLPTYIKLAKSIGVGNIQIQTNGSILFKNHNYIQQLINAGLNEIFLAQHSSNDEINQQMGIVYKIEDFKLWVQYLSNNRIIFIPKTINDYTQKFSKHVLYLIQPNTINSPNDTQLFLNIVINKINISYVVLYIQYLLNIGFLDLFFLESNHGFTNIRKISFGLVQPNGYAQINKDEVLLKYTHEEIDIITEIINFCKKNNIYPDFHFTAPPLCILNFPEYNLEYNTLINLEKDRLESNINDSNLDSYKVLWKEKEKFSECSICKYDKYCLGFYKNWIKFVGKTYVHEKVYNFLK